MQLVDLLGFKIYSIFSMCFVFKYNIVNLIHGDFKIFVLNK